MSHRTLRRACAIVLLLLGLPALAAAQTGGPQRAYMDTTCSPCRDFFRYANGTWLATTQIPASYPAYGMGREIADRNQVTLTRVLERAAAGAAAEKDPTLRKVGWLYAALMDSARADREALAPVRADIERIETIATKEDLRREFAHPDGYSPFGLTVEADPGQSTMNLAQLWQGGLGLPDRDYYFRADPKSDTLRQAYVAHVERVLMLTGMPSGAAREAAARVMKLETALAESSLSVTEMRDPEKLYHKMTVKELGRLCPTLDWPAFFNEADVAALARADAQVDVSMPAFLRQVGTSDRDHAARRTGASTCATTPCATACRGWVRPPSTRPSLERPAHRAEGPDAALEALREHDGRRDGRGAGQGLRGDRVPAVVQGAHERAGGQPAGRAEARASRRGRG